MKLWIVGCSISDGEGVLPSERWGALVSQHLNIDAQFLTEKGSSIEWAANQILQADIRPGDVVLWGLTSPNRYLYFNDLGRQQHILPSFNVNLGLSETRLTELNLAFKAVEYIKQTKNFLAKIDCKLFIGFMLPGLPEHKEIILKEFNNDHLFFIAFNKSHEKNNLTFCTSEEDALNRSKLKFLDVGTDGIHPGPKQHMKYAEMFLNKLNMKTDDVSSYR